MEKEEVEKGDDKSFFFFFVCRKCTCSGVTGSESLSGTERVARGGGRS